MTTRTKLFLVFVMGMIAGGVILSQLAFKEGAEKEKEDAATDAYPIPKLPAQISFANEKVPLERREIQEKFDRELIYNFYAQGHMIYLLKLSKKYFPLIEARLKEQGVPDDFKYLCVAESNLQTLTSKVGAQGYWQFMSSTAPGYNLEVSTDVDERNHLLQSTDAACKYLKQAYAKFGNWTAAAASYNCGMGGYNAQATFQKTMNYYDLLLPEETNKYIFRILSFKHIMSNADQLGFKFSRDDLYKEHDNRTVKVSSTIPNLADWALQNGTTYKMVKLLNPWLRSRALTVKPGKSYAVILPR
jgi:hypothetical protein